MPLIEDSKNKKSPLQLKVHNFDKLVHFFLDFDIKGHKILFEDKKSAIQQINLDGIPFIVNSMQGSDCVHGKDWNLSQKKKRKENKKVC